MKKGCLILLFIMLCSVFLTACKANADIRLTMDTKGNSNVEYKLLFDSPTANHSEYQSLVQDLKDKGYLVTNVEEDSMTGFKATKNYKTGDEFSEISALSSEYIKRKSFLPKVEVRKDFFQTYIHINSDLGDIIRECENKYPGATVNIRFMLTAPFGFEKINTPNAEGNTHTWNIDKISDNNIYADMNYYQNDRLWVILVIIAAAIVLYLVIRMFIKKIAYKMKLR